MIAFTPKIVEHARAYGTRGWRIVPLNQRLANGQCTCQPWRDQQNMGICPCPGKHPRIKDWKTNASSDGPQIEKWWRTHLASNIGVVTGSGSGLVVLDVDPRNGGDDSLRRAIFKYGRLTDTVTSKTGGGGSHYFFSIPAEDRIGSFEIEEGLEVKAEGSQVVLPPSIHPSGQRYEWEPELSPEEIDVAPAPSWLVQLGTTRTSQAGFAKQAAYDPANAHRVLDGCSWFRHCVIDSATLSEPEWYAMLTVLARCDDSGELAHEFSRAHPGYSQAVTTAKLLHAASAPGPVTCNRVETHLGGRQHCEQCPHRGRIKSPILIGRKDSRRFGESSSAEPTGEQHIDLPTIISNGRQLREITTDMLASIQARNQPPNLFCRSGSMVEIIGDENKRARIREVNDEAFRGHASHAADYVRVTNNGRIPCSPPLDAVRTALNLEPSFWKFPPLVGLTDIPVLRPDGTVLDQPGYDITTKLFYIADPLVQIPTVPRTPTSHNITTAIGFIDEAIGEFPFISDLVSSDGEVFGSASRANAIGCLLTPFLRPCIDGPVPLALFDAPQAGTGKSLLAEVMGRIVTGQGPQLYSAPKMSEEWRKLITTILRTASPIVIFDNVDSRIDNGDLAKALTSGTWADRLLGASADICVPVRCTWIATGNNLQVGGDMPRRCYRIRLDAQCPQPFRRTNFKHTDLRSWALEHRGELIWSLLVLCRAWYAAGKPAAPVLPMGSYESWSRTVGGVLAHSGIPGFLCNGEELIDEADSETRAWESFLHGIAAVYGGNPFRTNDLYRHSGVMDLLPEALLDPFDKPATVVRKLGRELSVNVGRRFGDSGIHIVKGRVTHGAQQWQVIATTGSTDSIGESRGV